MNLALDDELNSFNSRIYSLFGFLGMPEMSEELTRRVNACPAARYRFGITGFKLSASNNRLGCQMLLAVMPDSPRPDPDPEDVPTFHYESYEENGEIVEVMVETWPDTAGQRWREQIMYFTLQLTSPLRGAPVLLECTGGKFGRRDPRLTIKDHRYVDAALISLEEVEELARYPDEKLSDWLIGCVRVLRDAAEEAIKV